MPEEIEVDTDSLREQIDHEIEEHSGARLLRVTALSTAMLAALAAVASLKAGATVNDAILLKTEATQLQAQASDQWAYYQAKGIKGAVAAASIQTWRAAGKTPSGWPRRACRTPGRTAPSSSGRSPRRSTRSAPTRPRGSGATGS